MSITQERKMQIIRTSGLFDPVWYLARYPQLAGENPLMHFFTNGASGMYDPSPHFSTMYYLDTHPRVRQRRVNPLLHFLNHPDPVAAGLDPSSVLKAADNLMRQGRGALALKLAARDLPTSHAHTLEILRCNALTHKPGRWMQHLNGYFNALGQSPLRLRSGPDLFARLAPQEIPAPEQGPKITVIMAAWNAQDKIGPAVRSILNQSWRNLELIVVDDASTDDTRSILARLAARDNRMQVLHNKVNVGPYVCRNTALHRITGEWVTCHDTDEWAHPQRLALHMAAIGAVGRDTLPVSLTSMLRMTSQGQFAQIRAVGGEIHDGVLQTCAPSALFQADLLRDRLGAWDCARFGADKEMMGRVSMMLGKPAPELATCGNLSLDWVGSLTNNPVTGIHPDHGITPARAAYRNSWRCWQANNMADSGVFVAFPPEQERFTRPAEAAVPLRDITANLVGLRDPT
jgi:hypothetical protein